ncbi:MAG TPA: TonB-dependent receptor [Rhizomicrobium sp.]|nr:TonB-dependent receptor [Rhizomicrobium sp.]
MRLAKLLMLSATIATASLSAAAAGQAQANTLSTTIAPMPLNRALEQFAKQTGLQVVYVSTTATGIESSGAKAGLTRDDALRSLLAGTGLKPRFVDENTVTLIKAETQTAEPIQIAQAAPPRAAVETVTVTSSKLGGADVQSIPIAITALSQEQLTATQTAGGPDLVKQVPNLTFTKTNFTGYSIQIRGIGTQAISVTTDPAVAVAFNDQPFIRNHFFEQEFFDVSQVAILRGPQGTLYGRNATAGVVNLTSARPTDQFEAMVSGELGNYHQRRFEGMINIPIVDDRLDIRLAGEWTKRQGYSFNSTTNERIDGRDLWTGRMTIGWKPMDNLQTYLIWEHFAEDDDRIRSSKQLCKNDPGRSEVLGVPTVDIQGLFGGSWFLSQGCLPTSMYSPEAFQVPNGKSLPYYTALNPAGTDDGGLTTDIDPYANDHQSQNLRVIESQLDPRYKAKNDIVEFNADYQVIPALTLTSQTAFNHDFLWAAQDYNRFNTAPGMFLPNPTTHLVDADGFFCDPQLGCSNKLLAEDLSTEHAWQLSQEFRIASNFSGPLNFTAGGNYMHYETEENYYVFINSLTLLLARFGASADHPYVPGVSDNSNCLANGFQYNDPSQGSGNPVFSCDYIDPNPIERLNNDGHNYFLSQNPYTLNSYATFGEVNYNVTDDLKLIGGLRWTEDRKHFTLIPSQLAVDSWGYPIIGTVDQQWDQLTGRAVVNWTPKLDFTDQTLVYGSFAHGYKAGGANPPGAVLLEDAAHQPVHPLTFDPEFVDAFEVGTKNTLLDGALTFNASGFYYDYKGYQISEIVDRTSINLNFDSHVKGAEVEATWEPVPGLRFNFAGGYEATRIDNGEKAVDLMDRADVANHPDWLILRPFVTQASNCILPDYVIAYLNFDGSALGNGPHGDGYCAEAYLRHVDPVTDQPYDPDNPPTVSARGNPIAPGTYPGFDPFSAPNNGAGFDKELGGNELPNAPHFTVSVGAQYSVPLSSDWAGTLRGDFYWQDNSWARVFNDDPYDRIHGYTNVNLTLILTSQSGWQVMLYDKNVFNTTAITGAFLNSDDSGLTTNIFLTDPKLIGVRVTKNW